FLTECLDSVLAQDFTDFELLIGDDCSTDGTAEIAARYAAKDARVHSWRNAKNLGQAANLNLCLREARGEFIKVVFADDKLLAPHALRRMAAALADPAVALVATASLVIDAAGRVLEQRNNFGGDAVHDGAATLVRCLELNANLIGEPSLTMFRRADAARGYDARFIQHLDLEMAFHLLARGRFAFIAEPLGAWRRHAAQQTEVTRRTHADADEHFLLAETYFAAPWLRAAATRRMWFKQIYYLRKRYGARATAMTAAMAAELNPFWFALFWLEHKISQPLRKLKRHCRRP
ncbi:MAG: glycosyltransferase, partial [Verrucomicrobia bacterium]|nr:glycosyltransferase [Verrucomicrobiota bacterium]